MHIVDSMIRRSLVVFVCSTVAACGGAPAAPAAESAAITPPPDGAPIPATASPFDAFPNGIQQMLDKPFTGDLDALVKRRAIRAGVTFNRTHYFIDEARS